MVTQVPYEGLTSVEQSLVDYVSRGELLDLATDDEVVDEAAMRSWGDSRTCRASVIRDILRGRLAADPDPHGLQLRGARITGRVDLENLSTEVNFELSDCLLEEGIIARYARLASVGLTRCQLEHPDKPPLDADNLICSVLDLRGTRIIGHVDRGAVRLEYAHIRGEADCTGAALRNYSGPALNAHGLQVSQDMCLLGGFTATGHSGDGAVSLLRASIGGTLYCNGATLRNDCGPALEAGNLQVSRDMYLLGFTATGRGGYGAVNLFGAHIGGTLDCTGAALRNDCGPALEAGNLQVSQDICLLGFSATGGDEGVVVALIGARVGGTLLFDPAGLKHASDSRWQLTYAGVPIPISVRGWLDLLRKATPSYAAQPYQQLAAGCRALGDERGAREVLMAQRADQLARTQPRPGWPERLWGWITKVTLGYGYQPWRALLFLAGLVALSCVLAVVLGSHGALAQTASTAAPGRPCTVIQRVSVGLDLNLPVGTSMGRADCNLARDPASAVATWLIAGGWVLRVLAWVFAALFIAGFTSAVRKT